MMDQFTDRVAELCAKATASPTAPDSRPSPHGLATLDDIRVHDDLLADPVAYRDALLSLDYRSIAIGPVTFHGIAECRDEGVPHWIAHRYSEARPGVTFVRRSPQGQAEPNFIHTDRDMGDWTGIFYLNPDPPAGDGTRFWRHRRTGATASTARTADECQAEWHSWRDDAQWEPWHTVPARFNRLIVFPAPLFHSRAIPDNYGAGDQARLIQVVFGTGSLMTPITRREHASCR